jgi:hypothetical protein
MDITVPAALQVLAEEPLVVALQIRWLSILQKEALVEVVSIPRLLMELEEALPSLHLCFSEILTIQLALCLLEVLLIQEPLLQARPDIFCSHILVAWVDPAALEETPLRLQQEVLVGGAVEAAVAAHPRMELIVEVEAGVEMAMLQYSVTNKQKGG